MTRCEMKTQHSPCHAARVAPSSSEGTGHLQSPYTYALAVLAVMTTSGTERPPTISEPIEARSCGRWGQSFLFERSAIYRGEGQAASDRVKHHYSRQAAASVSTDLREGGVFWKTERSPNHWTAGGGCGLRSDPPTAAMTSAGSYPVWRRVQ